jgi:peroxiredoxin
MALTYSEPVRIGMPAPQFPAEGLLATNNVRQHLSDFRYAKVLVVVFMCNHCPYVKAVRGRINQLAKDYKNHKVQVIGINSNDSVRYPDDSFDAMKKEVAEQHYEFPYLWDETQEVARAYGAVCTPDFFVFENTQTEEFREADIETERERDRDRFVLRYRGRLDDNWKDESQVKRRDLSESIEDILAGREYSQEQVPSMGCSIKWKESTEQLKIG